MDADKTSLLYIPRISLHKLTEKLSKKAIAKFIQSNYNNPDWIGSLKIVIDNNDVVFIKFSNREDGSLYAKCIVDDYPSQSIQLIADLEKCLHLRLHNENGDDFIRALTFLDKDDVAEFKSVLKTYFTSVNKNPGNAVKTSKQSLDIIKAQIDQRLIHSDIGAKFFELYLNQIVKLNDLSIKGYDNLYQSFQKTYQDTLKLINEPKTENVLKNIYNTKESTTQQKDSNQRKRTVNEITIIAEDDKENIDAAAKTTKTKSKKGKLKKKVLKANNDESVNVIETKPTVVANPTKKQRLTNESESDSEIEEIEAEVKPKKKPQRAAKAKANNKISKSKKSKRSTIESVQSTVSHKTTSSSEHNALTKTPTANRFRIEALYESATKTAKVEPVRPVTRANAGKVKQTVQIFEQMKASQIPVATTTTRVSVMASAKKPSHSNEASQRILRVNASKIRSSIDKRKLRASQAKSEAKRKSVKKVNAFVKAATSDLNSTVSKQQKPTTTTTTTVTTTTATVVAASTTLVDQTINEDEGKSAERRMTRDILSSTIVQQQYRVTTTLKNGVKYPERKNSFAKFLERNTPSKMTKTELEDRRKAELLYKAKKEEERLKERETQQKEKIEVSKKKREEKMKRIIESKAKRQEDELKRREEYESKVREIEESKKRLAEEKKREEQEKQKAALLLQEKRKQEELTQSKLMHSQHNLTANIHGSAIKPKPLDSKYHLPPTSKPLHSEYDFMSSTSVSSQAKYTNPLNDKTKQSIMHKPPPLQQKPLETTYVLNTPGAENMAHKGFPKATGLATKLLNNSLYNQFSSNPNNYPITPLQELKLKDANNYDVSNLKSDDETDDEEEPSKPIPQWAKDENVKRRAYDQCVKLINYTKIFKEASNCEIKLDEIFRTKRKKFNERSSSANWSSPPIWRTGINGEESFRKLHFK